jgi:hypothetical protein
VPSRAPKPVSVDQALKRLLRLEAKLTDEKLKADVHRAIEQLQAAISAAQGERQTMADQISTHAGAIADLQGQVAELGQANANQARLIGALTQPGPEAAASAGAGPAPFPIIVPSFRPTIFPTVDPSASPSVAPTPSPSPAQASPTAIASAFQQAFSAIHAASAQGGPTLKSMDVQLKGFVQVSSDGTETTLSFPTPDNVPAADVLSTVSMSLVAVPELQPPTPPVS